MTPAGTSNKLDIQNKREENTTTHTLIVEVTNTLEYNTILYYTIEILSCVCVVYSSDSFWTSSLLDVPAGVTQDFSSTFLRCVPNFSLEEDSAIPFSRRP